MSNAGLLMYLLLNKIYNISLVTRGKPANGIVFFKPGDLSFCIVPRIFFNGINRFMQCKPSIYVIKQFTVPYGLQSVDVSIGVKAA